MLRCDDGVIGRDDAKELLGRELHNWGMDPHGVMLEEDGGSLIGPLLLATLDQLPLPLLDNSSPSFWGDVPLGVVIRSELPRSASLTEHAILAASMESVPESAKCLCR